MIRKRRSYLQAEYFLENLEPLASRNSAAVEVSNLSSSPARVSRSQANKQEPKKYPLSQCKGSEISVEAFHQSVRLAGKISAVMGNR